MGELIFVGLGLGGPKDMSVRALETLRSCDRIFAEFYTSRIIDSPEELEEVIGKKVIVALRKEVEEGDLILMEAKKERVAFLTAGDPMAATTHVDLRLRAMEMGITTRLVHGVSIFTAAASVFGLQPYKFGRTVTLPFPEPGYFPLSPYENILENRERGLHTLVLLDIKEDGRCMTSQQAMRWLLDAEGKERKDLITDRTLVCAAARIGSSTERIVAGWPRTILDTDLGPPLHSLIVPGKLHFMEAKALVHLAQAPTEIVTD